MARQVPLKRGVEETALPAGSATGASGADIFLIPAEMQGARLAIQTIFTVAPNTAVVVPILASLDGINFTPWSIAGVAGGTGQEDVVQLNNLNGEVAVIPASGIKAIKIGTVTFTGGGTVTVLIRIQ